MGLISAKASVNYTINGASGAADSEVVSIWGVTMPSMIKRVGTADASGNYSMEVSYPVGDKVPIEYHLKIDATINVSELGNVIIRDSLWSGQDGGVPFNISEIQIYMNNSYVGNVQISSYNTVMVPRVMLLSHYVSGQTNYLSVRTTLQYAQPKASPNSFIFTPDSEVIWQGFMGTPDIRLNLVVQGGGSIVSGIARLKTVWNLDGEPLYIGKALGVVTTIQNISPQLIMRIDVTDLTISVSGGFQFLGFAVVLDEGRYRVDVFPKSIVVSNKVALEVPASTSMQMAYTLRYLG